MNDLISRQAAIRKYCGENCGCEPEECGYTLEQDGAEECSVVRFLKVLPSVQPERKTGKWIVDALADNIYRCSECGIDAPVEPTGGTEYKSNYCQNCGAYMRERRTE